MATATLIQATVEVVGKVKEGNFGPYCPVLFKLADGSEQWKSYKPSAPELGQLRKGQTYQMVKVGDELKLVDPAQTPTATPAAPSDPYRLSDELKRSIATYASEQIKAFKFIYNAVGNEFEGVSAEDQRTIATTIYLQTQRKFGL